MTTIAVIVGSLRKQSFNRSLAEGLVRLAPAGIAFTWPDIASLPLYNQDDDGDQPAAARAFKAMILAADAVIFVTPEYNRSIPGVLKNAIDHASRPYGESAWTGKPAGVIGISPGAMSTALAQQHLRNVLVSLDMPAMAQPEAFLRKQDDTFDEDGGLGEKLRPFAEKWLTAFLAFAARNRRSAAVK